MNHAEWLSSSALPHVGSDPCVLESAHPRSRALVASSDLDDQRFHTPHFITSHLDHEPLHLVLERADLAHQVTGLVGRNAAADDRAADTASAAESHLGGDVDL